MPALQVRDFPEDLYEQFAACAKREHRSIAQQTIVAAETYLKLVEGGIDVTPKPPVPVSSKPLYWFDDATEEERQARIAKRKALFAEIDAEDPVPELTTEMIVQFIHEGRDERDSYIGC